MPVFEPVLYRCGRARTGLEGRNALLDALVVDAGYGFSVIRSSCSGLHDRTLAPLPDPTFAQQARVLRREIHGHGQRGATPVRKTTWAALVLLDQKPPRQPVFFRVAGLAGATAEVLIRYANRHLGIAADVLDPVRAVAAPGEHVEGTCLRNEGEPDLDLVRAARQTPRRRQITEVLARERTEINHERLQVCRNSTRR